MASRSTSLLSRYPLLSTKNLSVARDVTTGFWADHESESLGPTAYALEMNRVALGETALTFVDCSTRLRVVATRPHQIGNLYVLLSGVIEVFVDGVAVRGSPARPLFRGAYQQCTFECSPARCLVVDVPLDALRAAGRRSRVPAYACLDAEGASDVVRWATRLVQATNRSVTLPRLQAVSPEERLQRMPAALRRTEQAFLTSLRSSLRGQKGSRVDARDHVDVEKLKLWLEQHAAETVQMGDLARLAGVSTRTIERAFARTGCGPLEYLRSVRMENARRMLASPTSDASVGSIARAVGFRHMGRFAEEYRQRFGESPSDALFRARQRSGWR